MPEERMKLHTTQLDLFYTAFDNNTGNVIGDYESAIDLIDDVSSYTRVKYSGEFKEMFVMSESAVEVRPRLGCYLPARRYGPWTNTPWFNGITIRKNIYVLDSSNRLVDIFKIRDEEREAYRLKSANYRRYNNPHRDYDEKLENSINKNLVRKKHNVNKIKESYNHKKKYFGYSHEFYYNFEAGGHFAHPQTMSIHRAAANVLKDEGEPNVRPRVANAPNSYDDKIISRCYTSKSWKHNSKRRKQWKPK
jgi:hypothetical protein